MLRADCERDQPAPVVRGYVVGDTYHRVALTASGIDDPSAIYPPELQADALAALEGAMDAPSPVVAWNVAVWTPEDGGTRVAR